MKFSKKLKASLLMGASVLALGACASNGASSIDNLEEATAKYDSIQNGTITMDYDVSSPVYGDYNVNLAGQFERTSEDEAVKESATATSESTKESATATSESTKESETATSESSKESETATSEEEVVKSPSRNYDYSLVEKTSAYVDGQETNSTGEVIALGDKLFDKVFLTGSEADGKFVYDSRDVGITEYPVSDYLEIAPLIEAFDLEGNKVEVEKGELHNGEKGQVFTLTPEQVVTSLQGEEGSSALGQNILGLVSETAVDTVIIGVNEGTFSVEVLSTGTETPNDEPTSEAGDDKESKETTEATTNQEEELIGHLVVEKEEGKVEIKEPTNKMDLDEFSALIELYYQQQSEDAMEGQIEDGEVYDEEVPVEEGTELEVPVEEGTEQDTPVESPKAETTEE